MGESTVNLQTIKMPFIEILNPQTFIPDVKSKYTIVDGSYEEAIDLNEDSWATEYFVLFFHTGPQDPVATSILRSVDKKNDKGPDQLTCKVIGVSIDTIQTLFDWLDHNPDLKDFDVPLMSDKPAEIARQFGVLQQAAGQEQTGAGFPANSVFIIDSKDMVRYHCVLDSRVAFNVTEIARLVRAFQETDKTKGLAMADFKNKEDIVTNKIPNIKHYYGIKYGKGKHSCDECPKREVASIEAKSKNNESRKPLNASAAGDADADVPVPEVEKENMVEKQEEEGFLSGMLQKMKNLWSSDARNN